MNQTAQELYKAFKILEEKKKQEQQAIYATMMKVAQKEIAERKKIEDALALADWYLAQMQESKPKPQRQRQLSMLDFTGGY